MNLKDIIDNIDTYDDDFTIYAEKFREWSGSSRAVVAEEPEDGSIPDEAKGMVYLLEVYIVKEVIEVWSDRRNGRLPTSDEKCDAVIYYAKNDAYLPVR